MKSRLNYLTTSLSIALGLLVVFPLFTIADANASACPSGQYNEQVCGESWDQYRVQIPLSGNSDEAYGAGYWTTTQQMLTDDGVPSSEQRCIFDKNLLEQCKAVAQASELMLFNSSISQCLADYRENYQSTIATSGSYEYAVAKIEGSESALKPCHCKLSDPRLPGREYDFYAGNASQEIKFTVCHNRILEGHRHDLCDSSETHHLVTLSPKTVAPEDADDAYAQAIIGRHETYYCSVAQTVVTHRPNHSCFAPGTKILMGDGKTTKKVEEIQAGDSVWNPAKGFAVFVDRVAVGPESTPLIRIKTAGSEMTVSERHPMAIPVGSIARPQVVKTSLSSGKNTDGIEIRMARELEVGNLLLTADGKTQKIESIEILPLVENQEVWNLQLRSGNKSNLDNHLLVAEGIVTGDLNVQLGINKALSD